MNATAIKAGIESVRVIINALRERRLLKKMQKSAAKAERDRIAYEYLHNEILAEQADAACAEVNKNLRERVK